MNGERKRKVLANNCKNICGRKFEIEDVIKFLGFFFYPYNR